MVDYVIPGNDDAVRAIKVVLGALTNAIVEVNGGTIVDYVTEDETRKNMKQSSFDKKEEKGHKFFKKERKENNKEVTEEKPKKK